MDEINAATDAFAHEELITIDLEGCPETFSVAKTLLCNASEYFVKALNGDFMEAQSRTLKMPGCNADVFRVFLYYATNRNLPKLRIKSKDEFATLDAALWHRMKNLMVRTYIFADSIMMPKFAKEALDCLLIMVNDTYIHVDTVELIYELSPEGSDLRYIAAEEVAWTQFCICYGRKDLDRFGALPEFFANYTVVRGNYTELEGYEGYFPHSGPSEWAYTVEEKPRRAI